MQIFFVSGQAEAYCKKFKNHSPMNFLFEPKIAHSKLVQARLTFYQKAINPRSPDGDSKINITVYKLDPHAASTSDQFVHLLTIEVL